MSLRLFWKITPKHKRELLLSVMGPIEQKQFRKIVEGKTGFPKCFSSRKAIYSCSENRWFKYMRCYIWRKSGWAYALFLV